MNSGRGRRIGKLAVAVLAFGTLGWAGHRLSVDHIRYYTGVEPESVGCLSCHFVAYGGTIGDRLANPRYRSPLNLAVSADGRRLYATASRGDSLLVIDLESQSLQAEIPVGAAPHTVALAPEGGTAWVTNEGADSVSVLDLESGRATGSLAAGSSPAGVALSPDGGALFVANWFGHDISVIDRATGDEVRRLPAGSNPYDMAVTPDGRRLLVTNQLSRLRAYPESPASEVTVVDIERRAVQARIEFADAHLLEGIAVSPAGDLALVTLVRPKNLVPAVQVARGWMVTNGLGVIDLDTGRALQVMLDEPEAYYADPCDVVFTPDGRLAFVSHSGADVVTAIDVAALRDFLASATEEELRTLADRLGPSRRFVKARIRTGANPKGLAVSPDGRRVYVAERLADRIAVIDTERLAVTATIAVGANGRETVLRRGERLFNSAGQTFQGQFSCRSCHPNNHVDRLQYDFEPDGLGRNIVDNRTLLEIRGTDPFKWNGKNTSMYMQCGLRFAKFLTRVEPFSPDDLNALVAFMMSLRNPANRHRAPGGALTPAQERGKAIFERTEMHDGTPIAERDRCIFCHPPPAFTSRQRFDVGSRSPTDDDGEFDTPQLLNVYQSAPYLHDGKALTLEEIWTRYNPYDTHGITRDLSKRELNDLIEYLKTL